LDSGGMDAPITYGSFDDIVAYITLNAMQRRIYHQLMQKLDNRIEKAKASAITSRIRGQHRQHRKVKGGTARKISLVKRLESKQQEQKIGQRAKIIRRRGRHHSANEGATGKVVRQYPCKPRSQRQLKVKGKDVESLYPHLIGSSSSSSSSSSSDESEILISQLRKSGRGRAPSLQTQQQRRAKPVRKGTTVLDDGWVKKSSSQKGDMKSTVKKRETSAWDTSSSSSKMQQVVSANKTKLVLKEQTQTLVRAKIQVTNKTLKNEVLDDKLEDKLDGSSSSDCQMRSTSGGLKKKRTPRSTSKLAYEVKNNELRRDLNDKIKATMPKVSGRREKVNIVNTSKLDGEMARPRKIIGNNRHGNKNVRPSSSFGTFGQQETLKVTNFSKAKVGKLPISDIRSKMSSTKCSITKGVRSSSSSSKNWQRNDGERGKNSGLGNLRAKKRRNGNRKANATRLKGDLQTELKSGRKYNTKQEAHLSNDIKVTEDIKVVRRLQEEEQETI